MAKNKLSLKLKDLLKKVFVVDSSVVVKVLVEEEGSELMRDIVQANLRSELTLMSTPLLIFEFFNVVSRTLKTEDEAEILRQQFKKMRIGIMDLDKEAIDFAVFHVMKNSKISFYDVAFHGLAKSLDAVFLTADERYYNLMKKHGNIKLFK